MCRGRSGNHLMNRPVINSVVVSPQSTTTKSAISIIVDVIDKEITFSSTYYYAGEIRAGEEVGII